MARAYCTLAEVTRILRVAAKKVRTSEAYRDLGYNRDNGGTVRLTAVTFLDSYVGAERFEVTFSDATNYEVNGEDIGYLGEGQIDQDFSCSYFSISTDQWSGTPVADDRVHFISCSNVSTDDATAFIAGVSKWVNNQLGVAYGDSSNIPWESDLSVSIPEALNYAASYRSAYEIFSSVFAGADLDESPVEKWNRIAEDTVERFIKWKEEEGVESAPRWKSREIFFDELGVDGVGKGAMDVTSDTEDDESYDR